MVVQVERGRCRGRLQVEGPGPTRCCCPMLRQGLLFVCLSLEQPRETLSRVLSLPPGVLDLNKIFPKGSMNVMTLSHLIQLFLIIIIF